jgi:hypothetical protein
MKTIHGATKIKTGWWTRIQERTTAYNNASRRASGEVVTCSPEPPAPPPPAPPPLTLPPDNDAGASTTAVEAANEKYQHKASPELSNPPNTTKPEPPPLPINTQLWYYSEDGKRVGPVNDEGIRRLVDADVINQNSLMWCEGMTTWSPASQTDIRTLFGKKPPPLPGESVDNRIVWILAFAPIFIEILSNLILSFDYHGPIWLIGYSINSVLCYNDAEKLKNAGHNTKGLTTWVIFVPVYLFLRASRLKQSVAYAVVWLVTFFVSLYI